MRFPLAQMKECKFSNYSRYYCVGHFFPQVENNGTYHAVVEYDVTKV